MDEFNSQIEQGNSGKREINNAIKNLEESWDDFNKKELLNYIKKALLDAKDLVRYIGDLCEKKESALSNLFENKNLEDILLDLKNSINLINILKEECENFKNNFKDTKDEDFNEKNKNKLDQILEKEENISKTLNDLIEYINLRKNEIKN